MPMVLTSVVEGHSIDILFYGGQLGPQAMATFLQAATKPEAKPTKSKAANPGM